MSFLTKEQIEAITVDRIAYHDVGGKEGVKHHDEPTSLTVASGFFKERIQSVCAGTLLDFNPQSAVRRYSSELLTKEDKFLTNTRELADLFDTKHKTQMQPGCFMVMLLSIDKLKLVALMKYDQQEVIRALFDKEKGHHFESLPSSFVKDKNAIQKSAIIRLHGKDEGELIVTDRNKRSGLITRYFKEFLGAGPRRTDREATKVFYTAAKQVLTNAAKNQALDAEQTRALHARMRGAMVKGIEVNTMEPEPILASMSVPEILTKDLVPELEKLLVKQQLFGESFTLDPSGIPRPADRKIETYEGIRVHLPEKFASQARYENDKKTIIIDTVGVILDEGPESASDTAGSAEGGNA